MFQQWDGEWIVTAGGPNGLDYVLLNKVDKGYHAKGTTLTVRMMGKFSGALAPSATAVFVDLTGDTQTVPPIVHPHCEFNFCSFHVLLILYETSGQ